MTRYAYGAFQISHYRSVKELLESKGKLESANDVENLGVLCRFKNFIEEFGELVRSNQNIQTSEDSTQAVSEIKLWKY